LQRRARRVVHVRNAIVAFTRVGPYHRGLPMLGFEGLPVSTIGALDDHISPAVEDALLAVVKTLGRSVPAPRRDPFRRLARVSDDGPGGAVVQFFACRPSI